jgi:hypothetical protein
LTVPPGDGLGVQCEADAGVVGEGGGGVAGEQVPVVALEEVREVAVPGDVATEVVAEEIADDLGAENGAPVGAANSGVVGGEAREVVEVLQGAFLGDGPDAMGGAVAVAAGVESRSARTRWKRWAKRVGLETSGTVKTKPASSSVVRVRPSLRSVLVARAWPTRETTGQK